MSTPLYEEYLLVNIVPELAQGRPDWDLPHTLKVVEYVKIITDIHSAEPSLNRDVLIISAYLHDYGYRYFLDDIIPHRPTLGGRAKEEHALKSAEKWQEIKNHEVFNFLSEEDKDQIEHLILVHDKVYDLQDIDELVLMEADTLGALGTKSQVDVTSDAYQRYLRATQEKRISRFITPYAKDEAERLLSELLI
ncbi:MAG: HD domain-containing protein [Patescibacteria group bacterium]